MKIKLKKIVISIKSVNVLFGKQVVRAEDMATNTSGAIMPYLLPVGRERDNANSALQ